MGKDALEFLGYEFSSWQFTVEKGKIREFAIAIGDENPLYFNSEAARAAGLQYITVPPTFLTAVDMWGGLDFFQLMEILNLNPAKVLHGEQEYDYYGEIYPGDILIATARVSDVKSKSGGKGTMNLFTIETRYVNEGSDLVAIARSVVVEFL